MVYEHVIQRGWFARIRESLKGIVAGLVILAVAVVLQFWNEGRTLKREQTLVEGRAQVVEVAAASPARENDGRLVYVHGQASAGAPLADETFGVEQQALALRRHVEMYQWAEKKQTREEKQAGGGTREVTTYSYEQRWDDEPIDSSGFREAGAHPNPGEMPYRDESWRAADIRLGGFRLGGEAAADLGGWDDLAANQVQLPPNLAASFRSEGQWFVSSEDAAKPAIGDLRVRFEIIPEGPLSLVARQQEGVLDTWTSSRGGELLMVERGKVSAQALFDDEASSNETAGWALRAAGFVLGWIGFGLILRPFSVLADVVPVLGRLVGAGLGFVSGLLAAGLSIVAIASGWLWYRPWLLGLVALVVVALIAWLVMRRSRARATVADGAYVPASPPPPPPPPSPPSASA